MHRISLRHNFETAHRLSSKDAPIKCQSIHGHSWWVTATIEGDCLDEQGMVIEFGAFKKAWRTFLDDTLDHHLVVKKGDVVAAAIRGVQPEARILELDHEPSTELLAEWIFHQSELILQRLLPEHRQQHVRLKRIHVQETSVNAAEYER